jgi:hypothetical protein
MSIEMGTYFHGFPICQSRLQKYYLKEQQKHGIEYPNLSLSDLDNYSYIHVPVPPVLKYQEKCCKWRLKRRRLCKLLH